MRKLVAEMAGVSEATVSRVFSGSDTVKENTRSKVLKAAQELGYVPNELARQLARKKSGNLGVILPYVPKARLFSTYYFYEMLGGISEAAQEHGVNLLLLHRKPDENGNYELLFRQQKVDGLIVLGAREVTEEREELLQMDAEGRPFAFVNQRMDGLEHRAVEADHRRGSFLACAHLLEQGWDKPAFVKGPGDFSNTLDRLEGFRDALPDELKTSHAELQGNYSRTSGLALAEEAASLLRSGIADAFAAANDRMAIGLLQGLKQRGFEAGQDYGLTGFDDSDGARLTDPALTSIAASFFETGREAALIALKVNSTPAAKLPVQLVVRESSLRG
ncbi:LacI family transcriptional regulator [Paenibacillus pasadenensis]|uniref:LacI family DNA-binding transcriptional regulator n=1 Tax=Paenibacillus pasadenensis TaxID=217090 RepID=UPI00203D0D5E|nr:LacI family DNA-binding transcriptional regulator [Paenibacillus pasadenensis]MCM3749723.1 LacI family transcriptional regulator [Paenibacillus pasadenensis]